MAVEAWGETMNIRPSHPAHDPGSGPIRLLLLLAAALLLAGMGCGSSTTPSEGDAGAIGLDGPQVADVAFLVPCGNDLCEAGESAATCPADCGSECGDGVCNGEESTASCSEDCGALCGDGACGGVETTATCAVDCGTSCGDGVCAETEVDEPCPDDCGDDCGDDACSGDESSVTCVADCGSSCGDGACNGDEASSSCPADCGSSCGDGSCTEGESTTSCSADCGSICGDGACNGIENSTNCVADCGALCGDGTCNGAESSANCVSDCGILCGDGVCNGEESPASCPADCPSSCDDGACTGDEDTANCPSDCGSACGDEACNGPESSATCAPDCGAVCGDGACNGGEANPDCPVDCPAVCDDGVCAPGQEDCGTCPGDCPCPEGQSCEDHACVEAGCTPETCGSLGVDCGVVDDGCGVALNCGPCDPPDDCELPPLSASAVGLQDHSLADDSGPYLGLGASLFWAAWAYKFDPGKLEQNLQFLADSGFNYIRALGVVGDVDEEDYWDGREIDFNWPDYDDVIAGVTDLAWDQYGLRVQWTLIGDGQVTVPSTEEKYALADAFLDMSKGREHKIVLLETANEYWLNGFPGDEGLGELRDLTAYLRAGTDILVAASAPDGHECEDAQKIYDGCVADMATIHFDRDIWKTEGSWRPVRQPWEHQFCDLPVGINNEPIGPGASVNTEFDPVKLVAGAVVTYLSSLPMHVFHSNAGVLGFEDLMGMAGASSFSQLPVLLAPDLSSWESVNAHWGNAPFQVFAGDADGLYPDLMWVDLQDPTSGVVRAYGAISGKDFVVFPIGILGSVTMAPRQGMDFAVVDPISGATLACYSLPKDQQFTWSEGEAVLMLGSFWCGDGPCEPSDCVVADAFCGDGICALGAEDCTSCIGDCPCPDGQQCANSQCLDGTPDPFCGDQACDPGVEDCGNCAVDCPCPEGEECQGGQCVEPDIPECGNGQCLPGVEHCGNCPGDCPCPEGKQCTAGQCVDEDAPECGNGLCKFGVEDCQTCLIDCPCSPGVECVAGQCNEP